MVILSSNTIFIDRIYNDAKLKETSHFFKIMHLDKNTVEEWLIEEGFNNDEIDLIWDYFGGSIPRIQKMLKERDTFENLKEYLNQKAFLAYTEIVDFLARGNSTEEERIFREIAKIIVDEACRHIKKYHQ